MPRDEYRISEMLCGNGDHSANGTRLDKLEEMQGSSVRSRMSAKLIIPVMLWDRNVGYNEDTRKGDECKRDDNAKVNVCRLTRNIGNEHLRGTTRVAQASIRSLRECRTGKVM